MKSQKIKAMSQYTMIGAISLLYFAAYIVKMHLMFASKVVFSDEGVPLLTVQDVMTTGLVKDRVNIDYSMDITFEREDSMFMTWLLRNMRKRKAETTYVRAFQHRVKPRLIEVTVVSTSGNTATLTIKNIGTISGAAAVGLKQTMRLMGITVTGTETIHVRCIEKTSSTQIKIEPNDATNKTLPIIPVGTKLLIVSSSFEQASNTATPIMMRSQRIENVTEIFKNSWKVSKSIENERMYGGKSERQIKRIDNERDHAEDIEMSYLFNGPMVIEESDDSNSIHRGSLEGLEYSYLARSGNVYAYSIWDDPAFEQWVFKVFNPRRVDGNQGRRVTLVNEAGLYYFWQKLKETKNTFTETTIYGHKVKTAMFATGTFDLQLHPLACQVYSDLNKPWMMAVHPRFIEELPFRDTVLEANLQVGEFDGFLDHFLTESTILNHYEELGGVVIPN